MASVISAPDGNTIITQRIHEGSEGPGPDYWAFISYTHADKRWADWLYQTIERYRVPRKLVGLETEAGTVPARIAPIFLDRMELQAGVDLDRTIEAMLGRARTLVVVCSPAARESVPVTREIERFRALRGGPVLPLIVAGRPNAAGRGADPTEECYPPPLRSAMSEASAITVLAADARPGKGGRPEAALKVIAGILRVNPDQLRQRELQRRRRRLSVLMSVISAVALFTTALAVYALKQRDAAFGAQASLLTQTAFDRLQTSEIADAQGIILDVLTDPKYAGRHAPSANQVFQEIRGADRQQGILSDDTDRVVTASYSPDGTLIVTSSVDTLAHVYSAATLALLTTLKGHSDRVIGAEFSPDSRRIVTASGDGNARTWDARSGALLWVLQGHTGGVSTAVFSPDGALVVTASRDGTARIWNASTGECTVVLKGASGPLMSALFAPDGADVLTTFVDGTARIWDARTGALRATLAGHTGRINAAAYSNDGSMIVTGSEDHTARLWNARSGALLRTLAGHSDAVRAVAFSPDGTHAVTTAQDGSGRVWDTMSGAALAVLSGHEGWVISARYSPDGSLIATTSADATARLWRADTGDPVLTLRGHHDHVLSGRFSPDGTSLVTASEDATARIWSIAASAQRRVFHADAGVHAVSSAVMAKDSSSLLVSIDRTVLIIDPVSGATRHTLVGHTEPVNAANYSADGLKIITSARDGTARIWDAQSGNVISTLKGHRSSVEDATFAHRSSTLALTASQDYTAGIWDLRTGSEVLVLKGHKDRLNTARFSPDDSRVVTASFDHTARIWDAKTGQQLVLLDGHSQPVNTAEWSADGKVVITASEDRTARIWDAHTGAQVRVIAGHRGEVLEALFSPDGRWIATCSVDRTARLWDARTGELLAVFAGDSGPVSGVAFTADQKTLITSSSDGSVRLWDITHLPDSSHQLGWYTAAQFDPLPAVERSQLGLDVGNAARSTSTLSRSNASAIDGLARAAAAADQAAVADLSEEGDLLLCALSRYTELAELTGGLDAPEDLLRMARHRRAALARALERRGLMTEAADVFMHHNADVACRHLSAQPAGNSVVPAN